MNSRIPVSFGHLQSRPRSLVTQDGPSAFYWPSNSFSTQTEAGSDQAVRMLSVGGYRPESAGWAVGRRLIAWSDLAPVPHFVPLHRRLMLPGRELNDGQIVTRAYRAETSIPASERQEDGGAQLADWIINSGHLAAASAAVEAHLERSARYLAERRFEHAAAAARHAIALAPIDLRGRRALALVLAAREVQSEVTTRVRRRADSAAADPQVLAAQGEALFRNGDLLAAEQVFRAAIRRAPGAERLCVLLVDVLNRQGRAEQAVEVLRELIAVPTRDPHVHARLGHILIQSGKLAEAEAAFRTAASMAPAVEGFRSLLADVLHRQGRNTDALAILQDLVAQPSRDPHTHVRYGRVLVQLGDLAGAEAAMRTATELQPDADGFHNELADVLNRRGERAEALRIVRHLVSKPTRNPHIHAHLGHLLVQDGDLVGAEAAFCRAAEIDPGVDGFRVGQADVLHRQGRLVDAMVILRDLVARPTRDPHVYARYGALLVQAGDLAGGEAAIRTATEIDPGVDGFHSALVDVLDRRGDRAAALEILRHLVAKPTQDPNIHARLGHILIQSGKLAEAEAAFRTAASMAPAVEGFRSLLADVLHRQGRNTDAVAILQDLVAQPSRDPHTHVRYGRVLVQLGDLAGAEAAMRTATELQPDGDGFHNELADVLNRRGERAEALRIVRHLVSKPTRNPHIHAHLGHLLAQEGDLVRAEAAFCRAAEIDPGVEGFHSALADVLNRRGQRAEALRILRDLVSKQTRDAHIHAQLGHMLAQDGDLVGAGAAFCRAAELDPTVDGFRAAQADVLDRQGWHDTALAILRHLAARPTSDPHIHSRLGHALLRTGDLAGAETAFRAAVALAPEAEAFCRGLADVLSRRGQQDEALGILRDLVALPDGTAHCCAQLGGLLLQRGDLVDAEEALREAIDRDPGVPGFYAALTDVLEQQSRRREAICVLQEAGKSLCDAPVHARLGRMLAEERDFAGAAAAWRRAVALAPENADFVAALKKVTAQIASQALAQAEADGGLPPEKPLIVTAPPAWRLLRLALGAVPAKGTT